MPKILEQYESQKQNRVHLSEADKAEELKALFDSYSANGEAEKYSFFFGIIEANDKWLAVGDHYGYESYFFSKFGLDVLPADICVNFLQTAKNLNYISKFSEQNVEAMTFDDNMFDFVFCRDSYHHFPRPILGVYEMLRVAKKGVIVSEPTDPLLKSSFLLFLCNLLDTKNNPTRSWKLWKNRFSFETIGNYVYKVSQREFEKLAMGIGLPAIAFRYSDTANHSYSQSRLKKIFLTMLMKMKILPYPILSIILFKVEPEKSTVEKLKNEGWSVYNLPENPYL